MNLQLHGTNFVISDKVRDYVDKKFGKLERYLPDLRDARIEIKQEATKRNRDSHVVQVTLKANGSILRAEERNSSVYTGIDLVAAKLHRQIGRYKEKRVDRRHGHHQVPIKALAMDDIDEEAELAAIEEETRQIVRTKKFTITSMNEDEAIEQMELLDHSFFVFFNPDTGRVNVLYRRKDGHYGLLDPELV